MLFSGESYNLLPTSFIKYECIYNSHINTGDEKASSLHFISLRLICCLNCLQQHHQYFSFPLSSSLFNFCNFSRFHSFPHQSCAPAVASASVILLVHRPRYTCTCCMHLPHNQLLYSTRINGKRMNSQVKRL